MVLAKKPTELDVDLPELFSSRFTSTSAGIVYKDLLVFFFKQ